MRIVVVGAGILGLATARQLAIERPDAEITVVEKEPGVAAHQTGHNSGVVHAGIYYVPGSLKARLCARGAGLLREFCIEHSIQYDQVGKLVVALDDTECERLDEVHRRSLANGIDGIRLVDAAGIRDIEPHARGTRALHSPKTAIVDYVAVAEAMAADLTAAGGKVLTSTRVLGFRTEARSALVLTEQGEFAADEVVVCAGLQSAQLAALAGDEVDPRIVPFRGEYYRLIERRSDLVKGLIYPVPDPRYPFLGIHLTRRVDGRVDVGPNAVLATQLEGYRRRDFSARDLRDVLAAPGFRRLARQHWRTGAREMFGSWSKRYFLAQARRYLPELTVSDLAPATAGVRAQALTPDGSMVDDFWISRRGRFTLVRNAPSPAATSSLAIGEHIAAQVLTGSAKA